MASTTRTMRSGAGPPSAASVAASASPFFFAGGVGAVFDVLAIVFFEKEVLTSFLFLLIFFSLSSSLQHGPAEDPSRRVARLESLSLSFSRSLVPSRYLNQLTLSLAH